MKRDLLSFVSILIILVLSQLQSMAQNKTFVLQETIKVSGVQSDQQIYSLTSSQKQVTKIYLDGFGRSQQVLLVGASPTQKDLIQHKVYDNLGRETKSYLPYASTSNTANFRANAINEQSSFYNTNGQKIAIDASPFSQVVFENSPLQRLMQQGSFGAGYQPGEHYKSIAYGTNLSSETVRRWQADGSDGGVWPAGTLSVKTIVDEMGSKTSIYTDVNGQIVLKREWLNQSPVILVNTYYVYDDLGQLVFTIPPKAVALLETNNNYSLLQTEVRKLIFAYTYDDKGRQIERLIPGNSIIYVVYDRFDRVVLIQDGNLRAAGKWNYLKYDSRQIPISQGIYTATGDRATVQASVSGLTYNNNMFEVRNGDVATGYYTNIAFPNSSIEPLAYSYFDTYDLDGNGTSDYTYQNQSLVDESPSSFNVQGMTTIIRKRTVGSGLSNIWLTSVQFYDKRGSLIQVQSNNHLNTASFGSQTIVKDFSGKTIRTKTSKIALSGTTTVYTENSYDHSDRLKTIDEKYNAGNFIRIAAYEYNELGQLIDKKLHSTYTGNQQLAQNVTLNQANTVQAGQQSTVTAANSIIISDGFEAKSGSLFNAFISSETYLQSVDYRYTIRGQISSINNSILAADESNDDSNDVFGMNILYNTSDQSIGNASYFNGLVSAVKWKVNAPGVVTGNERTFKFIYDNLLRLNHANYSDRAGTGAWSNSGAFDEKNITYDVNGNILTLQRKANGVDIDNLNYVYNANQLNNITDGSGGSYGSLGFKNLTGSTAAYHYDLNGNMDQDYKKGISFNYNVLNRTQRVSINTSAGRYIDYTYSSDGGLLRKQTYDGNSLQKTTDYIDGFVYENGVLSYFAMSEGRVRTSGSTFKNEYMIRDQLGNVRVSFEEQNGLAVVRQENSYYPFGLTLPGSTLPSSDNKNLFNGGSEWQNDFSNLPDLQQTFYRNYDAALARFIAVDPMAETAESLTPYQYALNNPIMFNDPLGDQVDPSTQTYGGMHGGYRRIGPGSGNHWSDGIQYSDWSIYGGSETYRAGIENGMWDTGGFLYVPGGSGENGKLTYDKRSGSYGYWTDDSYSNGNSVTIGLKYVQIGSTSLQGFLNRSLDKLASGFMANNDRSDMYSSSAILGYAGVEGTKLESLLRYTAKTATTRSNRVFALKAVKGTVIAGKLIGVLGALGTALEGAYDEDGFTLGDGVAVGIGLITTFTPYGWVYGIVDIGVGVATGVTLTDRISHGIDKLAQ